MEGIYALANPPKTESGLTMNYEFNLSGMSTQLIGRKFNTFPMIEDAPKLTEVHEFSWLKVEENALIGALESAALIACGAICVVVGVLLLPEIAAAATVGAAIAATLGVVVFGALAGASLFAGNGVFQETVSSTVNDIITQTNTSTLQFRVNISKAFTKNFDLGLRVGAFIGSLVATAVCPPLGGAMQAALVGGTSGQGVLSIAGIEAVAVDGVLVIGSAFELGQSIIAMAKGSGDTSYEGGSDAPYVKDKRVPLDRETVLSGSDYNKTNMKVKGASVYKNGDKYYYRDTLHTGKRAHLEVFDKKGNHLGEADPLTGKLNPNTADKSKKLKIK